MRFKEKDQPELSPDQAWNWTDEWQAGEREADGQMRAGESTVFAHGADFV